MDAYLRYGPALLRKAQRLLQNRDDAQDIVQTVFVELLGDQKRVTDLPYLYRTVTNRCLNVIRDRTQRARLLDHQKSMLRGPVRTSCEQRVIDLDLLLKLEAELDSASLEIVVYRFIDDMSQEEISKLTGLSRKTIGKRLSRVREVVLRLSGEQGAT